MSAESVVKALLSQWIARFGVPMRITSDRGRQFESSIFAELLKTIGTNHLHTTPYHPQSNGLIERWHRTLKTAILCHEPARWVFHLPMILLGLRVVFKPDINASPAELVYGTTLSIPGEFVHQTTQPNCDNDFVNDFRAAMQKLRATNPAHHSIPPTFVSKNLCSSSHVFVRNDSVRPSLTHPYDGPYLVTKRYNKFFTISMRGRQCNINIDRLKPAFLTSTESNDIPATQLQTPDVRLQTPDVRLKTTDVCPQTPDIPATLHKTPDSSIQPTKRAKTLAPRVSFSTEFDLPRITSRGRRIQVPLRFR